eukprot:490158_1
MTAFVLIYLFIIMIVSDENCNWEIYGYGTIDLSPLSNLTVRAKMDYSTEYRLQYTPCSSSLLCTALGNIKGMASINDNENCEGIISKWDNGITQPYYQGNAENETEIIFNYPLVQNAVENGCIGGRTGQFTFICDTDAMPYDSNVTFYQDANYTEGICHYHTVIRTVYACANNNMESTV